jgi:hypothetical protein
VVPVAPELLTVEALHMVANSDHSNMVPEPAALVHMILLEILRRGVDLVAEQLLCKLIKEWI